MFQKTKQKNYGRWGIGLSVAWIIVVICYLINSGEKPFSLSANEFGDFWAGALGPLGILWIVLGFWQQGEELRNSVEALSLQSEELRKSVAQQEALVNVTKQQAEAEFQALHEEREARKNANSPVFNIGSGGGGTTSASRIVLTNVGADCSNVKIYDQEDDELLQEIPLFAHKASHPMVISHSVNDHTDFMIAVAYVSKAGEHGEDTFRLQREPNQAGFEVEKISKK
jgi:hypothetical protein